MNIWNEFKKQICDLFKAGLLHVFAGTFLIKFIGFFSSIFLIRILTKPEYGLLSFIENQYSYVFIFAGAGLTNALLRYVILAEDTNAKRTIYLFIQKYSLYWNAILVTLTGIVYYFVPLNDKFEDARQLIPIALISLLPHYSTNNSMVLHRAMFSPKAYSVTAVAVSVAVVVSKVLFTYYFRVNGAVFSRVVAYSLSAIILTVMVNKKYFPRHSHLDVAKPTREKKIECFKYSLQFMITNGIWALFMLNDIFFLTLLTADPVAIADYKVAYTLPASLSLISGSLGVFVAPYFVKNENDHAWVATYFKKLLLWSVILIGAIVFLAILFGKLIVRILYGVEYLNIVPLMNILFLASFMNNAVRFTTANLLAATGRIRTNMVISFAGVLMQITFNIFVIPRYGTIGLAVASLVIYTLMAVAVVVSFYRIYFISYSKS